MLQLFKKRVHYGTIADLIRRCSIATSGECCEAMERFFHLKPEFNLLMYDSVAFLMSVALSELMLNAKASKKEDYERFERELRHAVGECCVHKSDLFHVFAMLWDEGFGPLTVRYYWGRQEELGFSQSDLRSYAQKYAFNVPDSDGFEMSLLVFISGLSGSWLSRILAMKACRSSPLCNS